MILAGAPPWLGLPPSQHPGPLTDSPCASHPTENLEYNVEPQEISHPDVGRYFSEFTGTHYVPNAELEIRYPEDLESVYETVQNIYITKKDSAE